MENRAIRVLLVEDDQDDFLLTRELLDEIDGMRYEVQWAMTYDDALTQIAQDHYDIFLFDYRLGARTGLELLQVTIKAGCKTPVILMTGQGDKRIDMETMKAGASDYLVKGKFDSALLERAIRYSIEQKRSEEQIARLAYHDQLIFREDSLNIRPCIGMSSRRWMHLNWIPGTSNSRLPRESLWKINRTQYLS